MRGGVPSTIAFGAIVCSEMAERITFDSHLERSGGMCKSQVGSARHLIFATAILAPLRLMG
jgi:hypothetical protein